jgi:hypothetical protein
VTRAVLGYEAQYVGKPRWFAARVQRDTTHADGKTDHRRTRHH